MIKDLELPDLGEGIDGAEISEIPVSVGDEIKGLVKDDKIFYDRHAGHSIEIDNNTYQVIKAQDVVVVL